MLTRRSLFQGLAALAAACGLSKVASSGASNAGSAASVREIHVTVGSGPGRDFESLSASMEFFNIESIYYNGKKIWPEPQR